jgi:tRNA G18 (ribose-2'-O)-methylase SpoU
MGTAFTLPHARTRRLVDELRESNGLMLYALTPDPAAIDIGTITSHTITLTERRAVVIGSERAGLSAEILAMATPVRIPMAPGVDSLNPAAAAAVACYALA